MAKYLIQASYSTSGIQGLVRSPENRAEAVRPIVEAAGGKIEAFYYAFGDYDAVVIADLPDNVSAAALSMAVAASGSVSAYKTTPLMTMEEAVEAMGRAARSGYRGPGG